MAFTRERNRLQMEREVARQLAIEDVNEKERWVDGLTRSFSCVVLNVLNLEIEVVAGTGWTALRSTLGANMATLRVLGDHDNRSMIKDCLLCRRIETDVLFNRCDDDLPKL